MKQVRKVIMRVCICRQKRKSSPKKTGKIRKIKKKENLELNQQDAILAPYGGFFLRDDDSMSQML